MRESFEKALAERCLAYETEESIETCKDEARWAYEWCQEKNSALRNEFQSLFKQHDRTVDQMKHYKKQIDQQAKVIAELKGELTYFKDEYCASDGSERIAKTLAKVEEMESKTP